MNGFTQPWSDVVVVGGGLAGLVAAATLARSGLRVTLLERARELGGRAGTSARRGFALNRGAHALYTRGAAARALADLGVRWSGAPPAASNARALVGDADEPLPTGAMSILTSSLLGWGARAEAARVFARLGPDLAREDETLEAWLARMLRHDEVRALLRAFFRLACYANCPARQGARAALAQLRLAAQGVAYVDGGWASLIDGLRAAAERGGARTVTCAEATAIERRPRSEHADRGWRVHTDAGHAVDGRAVIVATGPATAAALTGARFDVEPVHAACLDVALSSVPVPDQPLFLGIDRPLYCSLHSRTARVAPPGDGVVHVLKYLDPARDEDPKRDEAELEALLDRAQPGWRAHVVERHWLPRLPVVGAVVTPRPRPDVDAAGAPDLFVAGDWVGPDGMLADAAAASALRAAERVLRAHAASGKTSSHGAQWEPNDRRADEPRRALP